MGTGSFIANSVKRRESLQKSRKALLDGPGITRGPTPPPVVPAGNKKSPRQKALKAQPQESPQATQPIQRDKLQQPQSSPLGLDEETREEFLAEIRPMLAKVKNQRRAKLHTTIGRARRYFGGGF